MIRHTLIALLLFGFAAPVALAQDSQAAAPPPPEAPAKPSSLGAGHYKLDPRHSSVIAVVRHMHVSDYVVRFDRAQAQFDYDPAQPQATKLQASVDVTSLDVGASYSQEFANTFLGAAKTPTATFTATAMAPNPDGHTGTMTGDLTLNGVTRPVTFNVTFIASGRGLMLGTVAGFKAEGTIKRSDFGSHAWAGVVSDEVQLIIRGEFDKK
jgi:polyisoprenoid-binding protein YceI